MVRFLTLLVLSLKALIIFFTDFGANLQKDIPKTDKKFSDYLGSPNPFSFCFREITPAECLQFCKKTQT